MDFHADQCVNGNVFQILTIVDVRPRDALAIEVGSRLRGQDVVRVCNRLIVTLGIPSSRFADGVSAFFGEALRFLGVYQAVQINLSRPDSPTDNCHRKTFRESLRDQCPGVHWFGR